MADEPYNDLDLFLDILGTGVEDVDENTSFTSCEGGDLGDDFVSNSGVAARVVDDETDENALRLRRGECCLTGEAFRDS